MPFLNNQFMAAALEQAKKAASKDEVPVGAVVVLENRVVADGFNQTISNNDPTAHAEIIAIRRACLKIGNYRLTDCELYVTLEPCCMCAGAVIQARLKNLYFGAHDKKSGVVSTDLNVFDNSKLNHHTAYAGGLLAGESKKLLQHFFEKKRKIK
tara:strand:+ start:19 stop:480 length:462 start_codon:yes stop_codon:yes gene_type:complete